MNDLDIHRFVERVMTINTDYPGIGGASSGIIGGSGTKEDIAHELRRNVIAFATEYSKSSLDAKALTQLAHQLQGSFLATKMIGSISDDTLEALSSELETLISSRDQ